jgi:hypothetical protein
MTGNAAYVKHTKFQGSMIVPLQWRKIASCIAKNIWAMIDMEENTGF